MNIYHEYETDLNAEINGVWIELSKTSKIKVARWLNEKHQVILDTKRKPYQDQLRAGVSLPYNVMADIASEAMGEAILLGWEGLLNKDGEELQYSKETAIRLLKDLKDFRDDVMRIAQQQDNYNKYLLELAKKP